MRCGICKPKIMDCLTCPKNDMKESFCFDKEECSVPPALVIDGEIIDWGEKETLEEKIKRATKTWERVDVDRYLAEVKGVDIDLIDAAKDLVDAVERYVEPKPGQKFVHRSEILLKKNALKAILK